MGKRATCYRLQVVASRKKKKKEHLEVIKAKCSQQKPFYEKKQVHANYIFKAVPSTLFSSDC